MEIKKDGNKILIRSGILERELIWSGQNITTSRLLLNGEKMNGIDIDEIQVTFMKAFPNKEPQGIGYSSDEGVEQTDAVKNQTDALAVKKKANKAEQDVQWTDSLRISKATFGNIFNNFSYKVTERRRGKTSNGNLFF